MLSSIGVDDLIETLASTNGWPAIKKSPLQTPMITMKKRPTLMQLLAVASALFLAPFAPAAVIDLSSWTPLTLDFTGGQPAGNWELQPGNTTVIQTVNADPSFFLNNLDQTSFSIDGTWQVATAADDDYMGFVFGYQNSSNFYSFDWKQGGQNYQGTTAAEGMTIKKFTGATGDGLVDLSLAELWENEHDFGDMDVLATNHSSTAGWVDNRLYDFHLDFNLNPGEIKVVIKDGDTVLWDTTVNDNTFPGGQFGFYNYSQGSVEYAGFTQTGGIPTPDPDPNPVPESGRTLLLMSLGLAAAGLLRKRLTRIERAL